MIHSVSCDRPQFRTVEFTPGFNVVLAERTKESTKKDSRNGLGKTTLLEVIHFCLGAATAKGKGLLREPLLDWTFSLDIDLKGQRYAVHRNTKNPGRVAIEGDWSKWPIKPRIDAKTGDYSLTLREWNALLGWLVFDLPAELEEQKYKPSFRSLISYFIRKGRDAFSIPFEHFRKQHEWDKQVNNAFLLGLADEHAQKWQKLKDRGKMLSQLAEVAKSGLMSNMIGTVGELETRKVRLETQVAREQDQLRSFKVYPQYREIELEASQLTTQIHQLTNENVSDRRMILFYESSYQDEQPASQDLVARVYEEVGVILPEHLVRRLQEVKDFHQQVVANRKSFLQDEIKRLNDVIAERDRKIRTLTEQRASLLSILQTHGALEEYNKLQQLHLQTASQLEEVKTRIENLKKVEQEKSALRIDQERLHLEALADYEERREIRERTISLFNANSEALYEVPGKLIIDVAPTGFKFDVKIERSASQGIEQMKVFCYDLMLAQLWALKQSGPGLLIHDSTIFDGVDERQVAHALQLAADSAEQFDFQYICCLNSDSIPWQEFDTTFNLRQFVRIELTDSREDGGLLGIRF